jgi:wyosine [tRNA(Phe)-imidazoG37] synthetase (radical SAM superfamily)
MSKLRTPHVAHPRTLGANRYVYAVLSRRAGGISIGVNLSPHKACNFDCTYCQVDRTTPAPEKRVDLAVLRAELRDAFERAASGELSSEPRFAAVPESERPVVDVALAGDGEPTNEPWFPEAARIVAEEKERAGLSSLPYRILTNATVLHEPKVAETLRFLDAHGLDVWAKLDAGTEAYYRLVDRSRVSFRRVLDNILACARERPVTIQALFARHHGEGPGEDEIRAWAQRLAEIRDAGGRIAWVQVHSIARPPAESYVQPLTPAEVERIADAARAALPNTRVEAYRGAAD